MISTFTALIDANVFFGVRLRSLMLFLAQTKVYRARWTDEITNEWTSNLLTKRSDLTLVDLQPTVDAMNSAIPDCRVTGYEQLINGLSLPDPNDRHVLAAAIRTRANVIVTFNLNDFPTDELAEYGIEAIHPDQFLVDCYTLASDIFLAAVKSDLEHYIDPPIDFADYMQSIEAAGCPDTAAVLNELKVVFEG